MRGDTRCIDGRTFRHDPQDDDPHLETDIGKCEACAGHGCETIGEIERSMEIVAELLSAMPDAPIEPRVWVALLRQAPLALLQQRVIEATDPPPYDEVQF